MSVTRLKRKHRKNIARANNETNKIKNMLRTPVLKNVDLDELKAKFGQPGAPDVAAESDKAAVPATDKAAAKKQAALAEKLADLPAAKEEAASEGVLSKVAHAASAAADAVKHAAADAVEAVSNSAVVEKAKEVAASAADAVAHNSVVESVQEAAHNLVEGAKHVLDSTPAASEPTTQNAAEVNQTGTEGFDAAEAVTKPVNADGQEGVHPKPEIHL